MTCDYSVSIISTKSYVILSPPHSVCLGDPACRLESALVILNAGAGLAAVSISAIIFSEVIVTSLRTTVSMQSLINFHLKSKYLIRPLK